MLRKAVYATCQPHLGVPFPSLQECRLRPPRRGRQGAVEPGAARDPGAAEVGLRPQPFTLGVGFVALGTLLSVFGVKETLHHVNHESKLAGTAAHDTLSPREVITRTSFTDRDLSSVSQAGLVNNLNDGMAWGLFPLVFAAANMSLAEIGTLAAIYPAVWGLAQLVTGAWSCGGTWATPLGHCSPASSPTPSGSRRPCSPLQRSPSHRASWSPCACARPFGAKPQPYGAESSTRDDDPPLLQ
jgi:hypothetical protein